MILLKNIILPVILLFAMLTSCDAQSSAGDPHVANPAFEVEIRKLLQFTVPVIGVEALHLRKDRFLILDAREPAEYAVSHLPGAKNIGYERFDAAALSKISKDTPIVVYCSIGYRSEKIGEKIQSMGFTKVYNLYGSIFEWANKGYVLEKSPGKITSELHTYNEEWSRWVTNPKVLKRW